MDVWAAAGSLTPLTEECPAIPEGCGNLWLRASGADPWEYDILLERADPSTWAYKRDPRITRPLADVLWRRDGIAYLRPEVQLLLKATRERAKDAQDLDHCLSAMDEASRAWLATALRRAHPGHPWLLRLCPPE